MKKCLLGVLYGFFFITISSAMQNNQLTIVDSTSTKKIDPVMTDDVQNKSNTKLSDKKSERTVAQLLCGCLQFVGDHINPTISDPAKVKAVLIAKMH